MYMNFKLPRKNLFFITLSILSIFGYGFFVFAAPPSAGGYNPGETLDPECAPGSITPNPCIVKAGWSLYGNVGTTAGTNFLGTTDSQALVFKTNNVRTGFISADGTSIQFGLGAGGSAGSTVQTTFIGLNAGSGATDAHQANFIGFSAGQGATDAVNSIFIGPSSGRFATGAFNSIFLGLNAGLSATDSSASVFIGLDAGSNASNAPYSNFIGADAGDGAVNADHSNFIGGEETGLNATNAHHSNFIGSDAGDSAVNASYSNFIGIGAGEDATEANNSNFMGVSAGEGATNANNSNFLGFQAGYLATNANNSSFFGASAGASAAEAHDSTFIGANAGFGSAGAANSIFIGKNSGLSDTVNNTGSRWSILIGNDTSTGGFINSIAMGRGAVNTSVNQFYLTSTISKMNLRGIDYTLPGGLGAAGTMLTTNASGVLSWTSALPVQTGNSGKFLTTNGTTASWSSAGGLLTGATNTTGDETWLGVGAGTGATTQFTSMIGRDAGKNASGAFNSNFFGWRAGFGATDAVNSNFIGTDAGNDARNAVGSNFLGLNAGASAVSANNSNFIGYAAGSSAISADHSNFFGTSAGAGANSAANSNFLGNLAGFSAANSAYSNFLGFQSGYNAGNASNSIFIGLNAGYADPVNNTGSFDDFSILIGKSTSTGGFSNSIALGGSAANTASNQFMIGSATRPIDTLVLNGTGGNTCVLDVTVASPSCSSDENLKTNIVNLEGSTLDALLKVKTVSYNWINYPTKGSQIGFLAQDLEQYFPEVVSTAPNGFKTVSYGGMTPIIVESIREMNLNVTQLSDMTRANPWRDSLIAWLANATNGITDIFAKRIHTDELCVGTVCVTQEQFLQMAQDHDVSAPDTVLATPPTDTIDPDTSGNDIPTDAPGTDPAGGPGTDAPAGGAGTPSAPTE